MVTCIKLECYCKVNLGSERIYTLFHYSKIAVRNVFLLMIWITITCCFSFSSFHTFDVGFDFCCPPIQSKEEIKQLSVPSSKKTEEEEIWPPEKSVSGNSFELFSSLFVLTDKLHNGRLLPLFWELSDASHITESRQKNGLQLSSDKVRKWERERNSCLRSKANESLEFGGVTNVRRWHLCWQ